MAMKDDRPYQNLTALITGASTGIGGATAIALAQKGADVLIHYNAKSCTSGRHF